MDKKKVKDYDENEETEKIQESDEPKETEELEQRVAEAENNYKRALADYQNLQKRVSEEKKDWIRLANKELLLRVLTVLDTLLLAQQHTEDKNLKVSVQQFLDVLKAEGVTRIETIGQEFDPHRMEVINTGDGEEGKVIEEIRAGFLLHDTLLRPAQVKVGKSASSN